MVAIADMNKVENEQAQDEEDLRDRRYHLPPHSVNSWHYLLITHEKTSKKAGKGRQYINDKSILIKKHFYISTQPPLFYSEN